MKKNKIIPSLLILLAASISGYSEEKMRIAIMDFQPKETSKADAEMVSELIRNEMVNSGRFTIIERAQMGNILKEQGLQQTGCTDVSCAVEIGKILSANKILVGTVMNLAGKVIITGRIVDVQNGVVEFSEKGVADSQKDIYSAVIAFTRDLTARIGSGKTETASVKDEKKEVVIIKEKPEPGIKEIRASNPYAFPFYGFIGFSALSLGGGYYFNMKVADINSDHKKTSALYKKSTSTSEATSLGDKIESLKKDSEKYALYRNVSYGVGGLSFLTAGYFFYRYFTYSPPSALSMKSGEGEIVPLFFSNYSPLRAGNSGGHFFGGGVFMRF